MFVCLGMMVNNDFVPLKTRLLKHILKEVLIDIVIEIFHSDFDGWWLPNIVLVDRQPMSNKAD